MSKSFVELINEANKAILVEGKLDAIPKFFSPEYVAHITDDDITEGHDSIRAIIHRWQRAFPDLSVEVEILVEGADRIAWQRTFRATQEGDYMGFPATGRIIVWRDMVTSRFQDNLFVEDWVVTDLAEQLLRARKR